MIISLVVMAFAIFSYIQKQHRATPRSSAQVSSRASGQTATKVDTNSGSNDGSTPVVTFRQQTRSPGSRSTKPAATASAAGIHTDIGFRTQKKFHDHYLKHGHEFGQISEAEYLLMAQTLRDEPLKSDILEEREARGGTARFDRSTGAFLVYQNDLTISTFFHPNGGEAYFHRAVNAAG
jgi:hypothetical protein